MPSPGLKDDMTTVSPTDERLKEIARTADDTDAETRAMATELLALRASTATLASEVREQCAVECERAQDYGGYGWANRFSLSDLDDFRADLASRVRALPLPTASPLREALAAAKAALSHDVPGSCWATGPNTGDPVEDLLVCPGCRAIHKIDAALAAFAKEGN